VTCLPFIIQIHLQRSIGQVNSNTKTYKVKNQLLLFDTKFEVQHLEIPDITALLQTWKLR